MTRATAAPAAIVLLLMSSCARPRAEKASPLPDAIQAPAAAAPAPATQAVTRALIEAADHGTDAEATDAVEKLGELADVDPDAMAALRRAATSDRVTVRAAAAAALANGDKRTLRDLLKAPDAVLVAKDEAQRIDPPLAFVPDPLGGPDWTPDQAARRIREGTPRDALLAVAELKWNAEKFPASVDVLREAAKHPSTQVRAAAIVALATLRPNDPAVHRQSMAMLTEGDPDQRVQVASAMAVTVGTRPRPRELLDALRYGLREGKPDTQSQALDVIRTAYTLPEAEAAVPDIAALLASDRFPFRALQTLRTLRPASLEDKALHPHIETIRNGKYDEQLKAARALAAMGEAARPALWELAWWAQTQRTPEGAAEAIEMLAKVAPNDPLAFAAVARSYSRVIGYVLERVPKLLQDYPLFRTPARATVDALSRMKPPPEASVGPLLLLLDDAAGESGTAETQRVAAAAHVMLRSAGDKALPELRRRVAGENAGERLRAVHGMAVIAIDSPEAMRLLGEQLKKPDDAVRLAALNHVITLGPLATPLVPNLRLDAASFFIAESEAAIDALVAIGPGAKDAVSDLHVVYAYQGYSESIRRRAAVAILKIAPDDPNSMALAQELARNGRLADILEALPHLAEPQKLVPPVAEMAARATDPAASLAFDALVRIGPKAAAAIPTLAPLLDGADNAKRVAAARALGAIGPAAKDAASARLGRMTDNADPAVRRAAADALVAVDPASPYLASAYLAAVNRRDTSMVKTLAPHVRATDAARRVLPRLAQIAGSDPDDGLRDVAARAAREVMNAER